MNNNRKQTNTVLVTKVAKIGLKLTPFKAELICLTRKF